MNIILGIGTDNVLYTRQTINSKWVKVPTWGHGKFIGVTTMNDGAILGIGTDYQLYRQATLYSQWEHVENSGDVIAVTTMQDGRILAVGTNKQLYWREALGSKWEYVKDSGNFIAVTIMPDKILAVGTNKQLYWRKELDAPKWEHVENSGDVIAVTIMPDRILAVGTNKQLYWRKELDAPKWEYVKDSGDVKAVTLMKKFLVGNFIGNVKIVEKDFEPGETATLEFTFRNESRFLVFNDLSISEVGGTYQQGNITKISATVHDSILYPQETTQILITLKSEEDTPVRNYTVLPMLTWTPAPITENNQAPEDDQGKFAISAP